MERLNKCKKLVIFVLLVAGLIGMLPTKKASAASYSAGNLPFLTVIQYLGFDPDNFTKYNIPTNYYLISDLGNGIYAVYCFSSDKPNVIYNNTWFYDTGNSGKEYTVAYEFTNAGFVGTYQPHSNKAVFGGGTVKYSTFYFSVGGSNKANVSLIDTSQPLITPTPTPDPEHIHEWNVQVESATCTASGHTWEECGCGEVQNETELPALGHIWEQKEDLGSCIVDSRTWEECAICAIIQNEVITPASGHVWIDKEEAATCTTPGRSWEECGCGEVQNEIELPALGHGILIYNVTQQPTVQVEGTYTKTCSICHEIVESGTIPVVTPSPTPTPTLAPSPDLMVQTTDFSFIVVMVMQLMKDFPLNLFLVMLLLCAALIIFDSLKKGISKK